MGATALRIGAALLSGAILTLVGWLSDNYTQILEGVNPLVITVVGAGITWLANFVTRKFGPAPAEPPTDASLRAGRR